MVGTGIMARVRGHWIMRTRGADRAGARIQGKALVLVLGMLALAILAVVLRMRQESASATDGARVALEGGTADTRRTAVEPVASIPVDERGCLRPAAANAANEGPEAPDARSWREVRAAGDRLRVDVCGSIWALWFNSWAVVLDGDPAQVAQVAMPRGGEFDALARSGVSSFLFDPYGSLWIAGRQGQVARVRAGTWEAIANDLPCPNAWLHVFDANVQLGCGDAKPTLRAWDEESRRWTAVPGAPANVELLATLENGLLVAAGSGRLLAQGGGTPPQWRELARYEGKSTALAADARRVYIGTEAGLQVLDTEGVLQEAAFESQAITGIATDPLGGAWISVRNRGLHRFDGRSWHAWRYAQGLPDDEARDVLLDAANRLWLGAGRIAMIDAAAADARIRVLEPPVLLPARIHGDACAAAAVLMQDRPESGQVAQATVSGRQHVFFRGEQACPDPARLADTATVHARRARDGAILAVPYNGRRGERHCGGACAGSQRATMRQFWTLSLHAPNDGTVRDGSGVRTITPPEPTPDVSPDLVLATDSGEVWISTRNAGVHRHDGERWHHYGADSGFGPGNPVQAMVEARDGAVWIGSSPQWSAERARYGGVPLQRWSRDDGWRALDGAGGVKSPAVYALAPVANGVAAGGNGGLSWHGWDAVESAPARRFGPHRFVLTIAVDARGVAWSAHGVFAPGLTLDNDGQSRTLTTRDGLFDDQVRRIAHDDEGRVWLLAEDGRVAVYAREVLAGD